MKYQKIVQALDMIFYLIGKQRISYQETQKAATNSGTLWKPGNFPAIWGKLNISIFYLMSTFVQHYEKASSTWV